MFTIMYSDDVRKELSCFLRSVLALFDSHMNERIPHGFKAWISS